MYAAYSSPNVSSIKDPYPRESQQGDFARALATSRDLDSATPASVGARITTITTLAARITALAIQGFMIDQRRSRDGRALLGGKFDKPLQTHWEVPPGAPEMPPLERLSWHRSSLATTALSGTFAGVCFSGRHDDSDRRG